MKILAFGASSSRNSINKKLASYAANQITGAELTILDLNDYEMPIFSVDREAENGIHELAHQFKQHIIDTDAIIISFAEHNGAYSAAFKNIMDWISRIDGDVWASKPMWLMATSPGARGGATVLDIAINKFKFMNKNTISRFSLPSFYQNFSEEKGILDEDLKSEFEQRKEDFINSILSASIT